ncbi:MAG: TusE/DsrC/DsvC family sulfur relay protein [Gammaproteobacteria bacterium]|nr:TusE/DsrC/DsvC family sulfur relay protein [Gammaproteobacteria bacterium]
MSASSTFTEDGFLRCPQSWSSDLAQEVATTLEIELTDEHWQVIRGVRSFYMRTGKSLSMRPLIRVVRNEVDANLGSSLQLARLFGHRTSRNVAMISGLPKPSDCI